MRWGLDIAFATGLALVGCDGTGDPIFVGALESLGSFEGYGYPTVGGAGGDVYAVTTLDDAGPGSLRAGVEDRDGPRTIIFRVGGEIVLQTDLNVRQPFLTVDGSTAPEPGITIRKSGLETGSFSVYGTHDVILANLRFQGVWDGSGEDRTNAVALGVDGDTGPDNRASNIVFDHITSRGATDGALDLWGEVSDVTISHCLVFSSLRASTVTFHSAMESFTLQRITFHHNVFAENNAESPKLRADVRDLDYVNNVVYGWGTVAEQDSSGVLISVRDSEPVPSANIVANAFVPTVVPERALVYGEFPGPDALDGGPGTPLPQGSVYRESRLGSLWVADNLLPSENLDHYSTVDAPLPVPALASVTTQTARELATSVLPFVGSAHRTAVEQELLDRVGAALDSLR